MKNTFFIFLLLFFSNGIEAKEKKEVLRVAYFKPVFGHIHRNPSRYSSSLTTIGCGHPVKVYKLVSKTGRSKTLFNKEWNFVKVGPYEGYIKLSYLSEKQQSCFQDRYPKFFEALKLDLTEMYYWGRLYDQYVFGKSRVKQ